MSKEERKDIRSMIEAVTALAEKDPKAFMIAKSNVEILKARSDMDRCMLPDGS